jgi:hypothetical protein
MRHPNCERCETGYLYRDDDIAHKIKIVVCLMCGERTYSANPNIPKKKGRYARKR